MSEDKKPFHEMEYLGGVELPDGTVFRTTRVHEVASDSEDGPTEDAQLRTASPLACLCLTRAARICYLHRLPVCQEHACASCGKPVCEQCGLAVQGLTTCLDCIKTLIDKSISQRRAQDDREFWGSPV